jgi:hypothetical protein
MKLFEEVDGVGELVRDSLTLGPIHYTIKRFQGVMEGSGLPIPGHHRIEGAIRLDSITDSSEWIGVPVTLRLSDGRTLGITLADSTGRVFSEGHGPLKCMCC